MARRQAEGSAEIYQTVLREEARNLGDHERVRALGNRAFGGGFTRVLRDSELLTSEDKDFLRELKYI